MNKIFALVDCNSFYCSCERVFNPSLNNRPIIVLSNNDGCAISRTDEAKALGIPMGAVYFQIKDLIKKNLAVKNKTITLHGKCHESSIHNQSINHFLLLQKSYNMPFYSETMVRNEAKGIT